MTPLRVFSIRRPPTLSATMEFAEVKDEKPSGLKLVPILASVLKNKRKASEAMKSLSTSLPLEQWGLGHLKRIRKAPNGEVHFVLL